MISASKRSPRKIILTTSACKDLVFWEQTNPKMIEKINAIFASILADPQRGIGKPERLKYELSGFWSRRINHRDRVVYQINSDTIIVLQLRDHY